MRSWAKRALRRQLLAARAALPAEELTRRADALCHAAGASGWLDGVRRTAAYVSIGAEPGTEPLLGHLRRTGVEILLPVLAPERSLDWAVDEGPDRLADGAYGLREPTGPRLGPAAVATADLVLVPALAVDRTGNRLGRGAGYYDRALAHVSAGTPVVAVVYAEEVLDAVPVEPHDRPVTGALTHAGWVRMRVNGA